LRQLRKDDKDDDLITSGVFSSSSWVRFEDAVSATDDEASQGGEVASSISTYICRCDDSEVDTYTEHGLSGLSHGIDHIAPETSCITSYATVCSYIVA
jgi:hypothetical protein